MPEPGTPAAGSRPDLRVALLGFGLAGRVFHAPVLAAVPGLAVALAVTADPDRAAQARADVPDAEVLPSADAVWRRAAEVDLVVVATPHRTHVPLGLAAVRAGLPVVVDKPLARSAAEGAPLVSAAADAGVLLSVYQNRRWDADARTARRLLAEGAVGAPLRLETRFERWRPQVGSGWRESGGAEEGAGLLLDLGSHQVDLARSLLGPVVRVYAELDVRRPGATAEDDVLLALTHAGGARSTHWLSATAAHAGPRLRLLGSAGAYVHPDLDGQEGALRAGVGPGSGWGEVPPERWGRLGAGIDAAPVRPDPGDYRLFYAGVQDALRDAGPPPVDPRDALAALRVLDAARVSAREGRTAALDPPA